MTDFKLVGWRASTDDVALLEAIREKTDETTISAVLRKSVYRYARENGIKVSA